jgi:tetratricopeptide (TPR) repeat protein
MGSLDDTVRINNNGARLLLEGNYAESFSSFQQAVEIARSIVELDESFSSTNRADTAPTESCFQERSETLQGLQSGHFYVYDRAILLPLGNVQNDPNTRDRAGSMARPSLIFNLAMAYHTYGRRTGRDEPLLRACMLYDVLIRILSSADSPINDSSLNVLKCLALNNCASLYHELCQYDESTAYFEALDVELILCDAHLETYLDTEEAEGIRLNVEHLGPPTSAGAA